MEEYKWDVKNEHVTVRFVKSCEITYCTISVLSDNKKIKHYHGGIVYNSADIYNERTGKFLAFGKALEERYSDFWSEEIETKLSSKIISFDVYHSAWSHFLSAMMDGKVTDFNDYLNTV